MGSAICANALDLAGHRPMAPDVATIRIEACLENGGSPGAPYVVVRRVGPPAGHEWPRTLMPLGRVAGLMGSGQFRLEPGADGNGDGKSVESGSPGVDIASTPGRKGRMERAAGRAARSWRRFEICVMLDHHGEPNSVRGNAAALKRFWPPETIGQYGPPPAPETLRKWRIEHRRLYRLRARMIA